MVIFYFEILKKFSILNLLGLVLKIKKEWFAKEYLSQRTIAFSFGSLVLNFFIGFVKVIISVFISSVTFAFNGIYNIILGFSKNSAIKRYNETERLTDKNEEIKLAKKKNIETKTCYKLCFYNLFASLIYLILSIITTFVLPEMAEYGIITALFIATVAFSKLITGIVSSVKTRKVDNLIIHYIKLINLSDGLISISLCQRALLCLDGVTAELSFYSGIGGIVFSALAIVLSAYMFIELRFIKKRRIVDVEDILED